MKLVSAYEDVVASVHRGAPAEGVVDGVALDPHGPPVPAGVPAHVEVDGVAAKLGGLEIIEIPSHMGEGGGWGGMPLP